MAVEKKLGKSAINESELEAVKQIVEILQDLDPDDQDTYPMTRVAGTALNFLEIESEVRRFCNLTDK